MSGKRVQLINSVTLMLILIFIIILYYINIILILAISLIFIILYYIKTVRVINVNNTSVTILGIFFTWDL